MIYFDNAATTYPKPIEVQKAMQEAFMLYGANPGRGGYSMAEKTSEKVFDTRCELSDYFNLNAPEHVIFTKNCTEALNIVIHGLSKKGGHFVCTNLEHNSVARPLETLKKRNICSWSTFDISVSTKETTKNLLNAIQPNTVAIICTAASNVFGIAPPLKDLSKIAHQNNCYFIVDGAQAGGILNLDMKNLGIDFLCIPGHKGLYGPMGTGALLINQQNLSLGSLMQGGTGTNSASLLQPKELPEYLESGTLNVPGIIGLNAGISFLNQTRTMDIFNHEYQIIYKIYNELKNMKNVKMYQELENNNLSYVPILSFNIQDMHSEEVSNRLAMHNIAVRGGFHCSPLAHQCFHTMNTGVVRISPSIYTKEKDVNCLLNSIFKIAKSR